MRYYVSKCRNSLNGKPYAPELANRFVCINPYYTIKLDKSVRPKVIIDSGAFQDVGNDSRLTFENALKRQLDFEKKVGVTAEAIVSYDRLVDEQLDMVNGQVKKRVTQKVSVDYVQETIEAAKYLSEQRKRLGKRKLILSCQGVSVDQYLRCIDSILGYAEKDDIIGFGGFCIISRSNDYEKQYYSVLEKAIPKITEAGIARIHIFGVGMFRSLVQTDIYCRKNGIEASYDTSSPELNSTFGRVFFPPGPSLVCVYDKTQKFRGYHPAVLAEFNIKMIVQFWKEHEKLELPEDFKPGICKKEWNGA